MQPLPSCQAPQGTKETAVVCSQTREQKLGHFVFRLLLLLVLSCAVFFGGVGGLPASLLIQLCNSPGMRL